ncbi:xanthine dehydrogenase molybdopterin binding subunit [Ferrovibrio sp.]|uniref:xanthine dehydrogenase molybdopterin binding subunit n=1 Tax=Ferrovibrio sp. TaxID=1917215 RepID=UPI001B529220|nr:xanthine dehydrogenase molybdopterin binding subunit [Ferrovibrio sp.]MBP7065294.1 xanthine dehydrogenase molybdopterin binding subunit [Ferrovibrio sp.]
MTRVVAQPIKHDSADKHVAGAARYIDDLPEPEGCLHGALHLAGITHGRILSIDLSAARAMPGVVDAITVVDVPGDPDIAPVFPGDPLLAQGMVQFHGQPVAAIVARDLHTARAAARLVRVEYEELPPLLALEDAIAGEQWVGQPLTMRQGDAAAAIAAAPHRLQGELRLGGQDHFYLEGQISLAQPLEDGDVHVWCSTQHPSEVQKLVARVLARPIHAVTVECRRMGGGFGGKETQAAQFACLAALFATRTRRPVKFRLDRDEDMITTGKRHDFLVRYAVGFDDAGRILGYDVTLAGRGGCSADLTNAVVDRAMFHADSSYFLPDVRITGLRCRSNTVSNTAFRGFGGPQGMAATEYVVDHIARHLGLDALDVRLANLYGETGRNITPYGQTITDNILPDLIPQLVESADYRRRRAEIDAFNAANTHFKKGLALVPVKFGISFTTSFLNQAGALVLIYEDGSVQLNHGGTEMGQGLYIKVAQVVAEVLGIAPETVRITATRTDKVPNTSATAASSGADLNGKAAENAALILRQRLAEVAAELFGAPVAEVVFAEGMVSGGGKTAPFAEIVHQAYLRRVPLSANGFYATPGLSFDRTTATGTPFYYFAYGVAATEALIDTLTGEYRFPRADLLHDCGNSLNPAIDRGQVEGGYLQGLGWLTMEELWWDAAGRLRTHAPSTYKIPTARDLPADFRVELLRGRANPADTIFRSKAVGEPPFLLGVSAWLALKDAVAAVAGHKLVPELDAPATPERVLFAVQDMLKRKAAAAKVPVA